MIYVLFASTILLFIVCYFIKRDIFHPICLICLAFLFSIFCAILNIGNWGVNLSSKTIAIILVGLVAFIIPGLIIGNKQKNDIDKSKNAKIITYSKILMIFFVLIQFIFLILYILWMKNYLGGFGNLFNASAMVEFRFARSFEQKVAYPSYINQGIKFSKALIYVYSFIFIHNIILTKKRNKKYKFDKLFLCSMAMFMIQTLISGGRSDFILLALNIVVEGFFIHNYYYNKSGTRLGKSMIKVALIILVVLYVFSISRTLVGRNSQDGFVEYISRYFGGSIQLFDMYIKNPIQESVTWGKETFYGLNKFLGQLGIINETTDTLHLEFRTSNGIILGNVYTAFRRMYQDFGVTGVIILNLIHGSIMSMYYRKITLRKQIDIISMKLLFYFMIIHTVVLMPFSDYFYSTVLSINYLNIVFFMILIISCLKNVKIKLKR